MADYQLLLEADRRGLLSPQQSALLREAQRRGLLEEEQPAQPVVPEPKPEDQSFLREVADVPLKVGTGIAQGIRFITDAFGADNPVSQNIRGVEGYLEGLLSAQSKQDSQEVARIMQEAEDKGVGAQVVAALDAFTKAPVDILSQAVGTALPTVVGGLSAGLLRGAAGAVAKKAAAPAIGAVTGAGVIKSTIYDETKQALMQEGLDEAEAERAAIQAQEYGGKNLDQIILGTALGAVAAGTGFEKALAGKILSRTAAKEGAEEVAKQGVVRGAITEAVPEAAQAGQEQLAANIALQREGFDVPTARGVAGAAALEGIAGGILGGGLGAVSGQPEVEVAPETELPPPPPEAPAPQLPPEVTQNARDYMARVDEGEEKFNWMRGRKLLKEMGVAVPPEAKAADVRQILDSTLGREPAAPKEGQLGVETLIGGVFAPPKAAQEVSRGVPTSPAETVAGTVGRGATVPAPGPTPGEPAVTEPDLTGLGGAPLPTVSAERGEAAGEPALTEDGQRFLSEYGQFETYDLDDGAKYTGALNPKTGLMEGKGVYAYPDGAIYEGEFVKSKFQGQGRRTFPSGEMYEGEFKNDKYNGFGTLNFADGSYYKGNFKNDKFSGEGEFVDADGTTMRGMFKAGKFLGEPETVPVEEALTPPDDTPQAADVATPAQTPTTTQVAGPRLSEDATDEDIARYVEEKNNMPPAAEVQLQEGDAVRVGNMPGTIIGVEGDYIKFRPVNARREKAYQRVPASMVVFESRPSDDLVSLSKRIEEQFGEEAGVFTADMDALIPVIGANMYGSNIADVAVKEMLQNSFDAVKESVKKGQIDTGDIDVAINRNDRTLTVTDNGVGMTPDIIRKAFFTIGGSAKELDPGETSGGLGMAKMGVLMGAERVQIDTVRDGIRTTVDATRDEIAQSNFKIRKSPASKGEHGTKVTLKIPENYIDTLTGDAKPIYFPWNASSIPIFGKPLVGPTKVTFNDLAVDKKEELPIGVKFDTKEMPKLTSADTAWGTLDVYVGTQRKKYPKHNVLSSGIWQFELGGKEPAFMLSQNEKIPYDIVVNVKPKVRAKDPNYPFENSRERFKDRIRNDIDALQGYLQRIARGEEAKELQQSFKDLVQMPRVEAGEDLKETSKKLQKVFDRRKGEEPKKFSAPELSEQIIISGEGVKDTSGKVLVPPKTSDVQRERSFKADKAPPSMEEFKIVMEQDPKLPVFHNNTNVDYIEVGEPYGDPRQFFAELGTIVVEMKEALGESGIYGYPRSYEVLKPENLFFGGISIDRGYGGIHLKAVPYKAIYINPFYEWGAETLFGIRANMYETITHELAHTGDMDHGQRHNQEMIKVRQYLADQGLEDYFRDAILKVLAKHESVFTAMKEAYGRSTTTNVAKSLEEYNKDSSAASARGDKAGDKGKPRAVSAGKRRGGDGTVPPAAPSGEPSEVGGGVGKAGKRVKKKAEPAKVKPKETPEEFKQRRVSTLNNKFNKNGLIERTRKYLWGEDVGSRRVDLYERAVKFFQNELRPLKRLEQDLRRAKQLIVGVPGFNNAYSLITAAQDKAAFYASTVLKRPMDAAYKAIDNYAKMRGLDTNKALEELDRLRIVLHEPERREVMFMLNAPLSTKRRQFIGANGKKMRISPAEIRQEILKQLIKPTDLASNGTAKALGDTLRKLVMDKANLDPLGDSPIAQPNKPTSTDINSATYNVLGGYSPEFIQQLKEDFARIGPKAQAAAEAALKAVNDVQEETKNLNRKAKYWSQPVDNIVAFYNFQNYAPLKGRPEKGEAAKLDPNDRRVSGEFAEAAQAMEGRQSEAENSILQSFSDAYYAAARAGREGVTDAVKNMIDQGHIKGKPVGKITMADRYLNRDFSFAPYKGENKIFHYDNDGNIEVYQIAPQDYAILRAIRRPYQESHWATRAGNAITGFFGQMHTRFNPSFAPLNFPRDIITNTLNIAGEYGAGSAREYFVDALLRNVMRGGLHKSGRVSVLIEKGDIAKLRELAKKDPFINDTLEWIERGGRTAYQQSYSIGAQAEALDNSLNDRGVVAASKRGLQQVVLAMDIYNDAFEFTNRVAAYAMSRDKTQAQMKQAFVEKNKRQPNAQEMKQIEEAAKIEGASFAKNLANFRLVGDAGREAGALFMFFRTAATGAVRAIDTIMPALVSYETALSKAPESVRKNPEAAKQFRQTYEAQKNRARWAMFITAAAGAWLYEMALAGADDDDQGRNRVATDDMARWTRYARLPVLGEDTFLQIPWGFGISAFGAFGAQMASLARGNVAAKDVAANTINIGFDSFLPIPKSNINVFDNFTGFLVDSVTPSALRPFVEYAMNTDNLGNEIYNSRQSRYSDVYTGGVNIPEFYKKLAKDYFEMTGYEVSPNTIYFWTSNYADALGRVATSAYDLRMFAANEREFRSVDDLDKVVPFIDSFIGTKSNYDARQYASVEEQVQKKQRLLNTLKFRPDDYAAYIEKNPNDEEIVDFYERAIQGDLKKLREQANFVRNTSELSTQQKRDLLKDNTRMQNLAKRNLIDSFQIYYGIEPK